MKINWKSVLSVVTLGLVALRDKGDSHAAGKILDAEGKILDAVKDVKGAVGDVKKEQE